MEFSRMYQYRLYPSGKQQIRLLNQFKLCKETYNTLLDQSQKLYTTNKYDFNSLLLDIKICSPKIADVHSQVLQNVSDRLHKAFDNFFNRLNIRKKGIKGT